MKKALKNTIKRVLDLNNSATSRVKSDSNRSNYILLRKEHLYPSSRFSLNNRICWGGVYDMAGEPAKKSEALLCFFGRQKGEKEKRWYKYIFGKFSPYKKVLEANPPIEIAKGVTINTIDYALDHGFVFYNLGETPARLMMSFLLACRCYYEAEPHSNTIDALIEGGLEEKIAFRLGTFFSLWEVRERVEKTFILSSDFHGRPTTNTPNTSPKYWKNLCNRVTSNNEGFFTDGPVRRPMTDVFFPGGKRDSRPDTGKGIFYSLDKVKRYGEGVLGLPPPSSSSSNKTNSAFKTVSVRDRDAPATVPLEYAVCFLRAFYKFLKEK